MKEILFIDKKDTACLSASIAKSIFEAGQDMELAQVVAYDEKQRLERALIALENTQVMQEQDRESIDSILEKYQDGQEPGPHAPLLARAALVIGECRKRTISAQSAVKQIEAEKSRLRNLAMSIITYEKIHHGKTDVRRVYNINPATRRLYRTDLDLKRGLKTRITKSMIRHSEDPSFIERILRKLTEPDRTMECYLVTSLGNHLTPVETLDYAAIGFLQEYERDEDPVFIHPLVFRKHNTSLKACENDILSIMPGDKQLPRRFADPYRRSADLASDDFRVLLADEVGLYKRSRS